MPWIGNLNWHVPLYTMDEAAGRRSAAWRDLITHSKLDDWWAGLRYQNQFAKVRVPVLHISGGMTTRFAPRR